VFEKEAESLVRIGIKVILKMLWIKQLRLGPII